MSSFFVNPGKFLLDFISKPLCRRFSPVDVVVPGPSSLCSNIDILPASEDGVYFVIQWDTCLLGVDVNTSLTMYPFSCCSLRHICYERDPGAPSVLQWKTVLEIHAEFFELRYTFIIPESAYETYVLTRLGVYLNVNTSKFYRVSDERKRHYQHHPQNVAALFELSSRQRERALPNKLSDDIEHVWSLFDDHGRHTEWISLEGKDSSVAGSPNPRETTEQNCAPSSSSYSANSKKLNLEEEPVSRDAPASNWTDTVCDVLGLQRLRNSVSLKVQKSDDTYGQIYGRAIPWIEEPLLPLALILVRHGEPAGSNGLSNGLSRRGRLQTIRTSELLYRWTNGFDATFLTSVWSSSLSATQESADILETAVTRLSNAICRRYEFCSEHEDDAASKKEDTRKDRMFWLLRAALRGAVSASKTGEVFESLMSLVPATYNPFFDDTIQSTYRFFRFPAITAMLPRFTARLCSSALCGSNSLEQEEYRAVRSFLFETEDTFRTYLEKEFGLFSKSNDHQIFIPHGALLVTGIHFSGRPCLVLADAGYLSIQETHSTDGPLPTTFTPYYSLNVSVKETPQERLKTDPIVALVHSETFSLLQQNSCEPSTTRSPSLDPDSRPATSAIPSSLYSKFILLMRAGHNSQEKTIDQGLTSLGQKQLQRAGTWIGQFFTSVMPEPKTWCVVGITSEFSEINRSLKESISILTVRNTLWQGKTITIQLIQEIMTPILPKETSLLFEKGKVYPENLFRPSTKQEELCVLVADDYHLIKYFVTCFGMDPLSLRFALWPHSGFVLIKINETGTPQLPIFGTVSHIHPSHISV